MSSERLPIQMAFELEPKKFVDQEKMAKQRNLGGKETIKIRAEINVIETKTIEKINEMKS